MLTDLPDRDLIERAQAGDLEARNTLVMRHKGFIFSQVQKAVGAGREKAEYFSIGVEKFIHAIHKFNLSSRNNRLTTYSGIGIQRACWKAVTSDGLIYLPPKVPLKQNMDEQRARARRPVSIDQRDDDGRLVVELSSRDETHEHQEQLAELRECMADMDARHRKVLEMRMVGQSLAQVAKALGGISRESVRQIEGRALQVLREAMAA